jgi:hypothetical protein
MVWRRVGFFEGGGALRLLSPQGLRLNRSCARDQVVAWDSLGVTWLALKEVGAVGALIVIWSAESW